MTLPTMHKDRPRILDGCCCAGGASSGYRRAGLIPTGVDIERQPNYPYQFKQADILDYLKRYGREFDVIHVSPPCQEYSVMKLKNTKEYPKLIAPLRDILEDIGKPYIIENVEGARREMQSPMMLCGTMFPELRVQRHRLFESNIELAPPCVCSHAFRVVKQGTRPNPEWEYHSITGHFTDFAYAQQAMGIQWMSRDELAESIPPHYTHWLGAQVMQHLGLTPLSWPIVRAEQLRLAL